MTRTHAANALLLTLASALLGCGDADATPGQVDLTCDAPALDRDEALGLYLRAVNEPDRALRPCLFQRALGDDADLLAASSTAQGRPAVRDALDESTEAWFEAAAVRELVGEPLFRHEEAIVRWVLRDEKGDPVVEGQDWIEFGPDSRIRRIHTAGAPNREIPLTDALFAWERAWNLRDEPAQRAALEEATTDDVRFSDLLVDITGREAVLDEILRQQGLLDGMLDLGEQVEVHVEAEGEPVLVRHRATITNPDGAVIEILNFIRLRDGLIERLSGYPTAAL